MAAREERGERISIYIYRRSSDIDIYFMATSETVHIYETQ